MKFEKYEVVTLAIGAFLVLMVFIGFHCSYKEREILISECLADGNKRYYCESLFSRGSAGHTQPNVIIRGAR